MRKTIALLLCLLVLLPAQAQTKKPRIRVEWGALAGLHVPDYSTSDNLASIRNRLGWQLGIVTAVRFGSLFAVEPQILYVRDGLRIDNGGREPMKLRSNSIDVPILASIRFLNRIRAYAGPVLTVMNNTKSDTELTAFDFGRIRPTLSYTIGAGVLLTRHFLIDLRYNGQFGSKHDIVLPDGSLLDKMSSYNVAFSVGYIF